MKKPKMPELGDIIEEQPSSRFSLRNFNLTGTLLGLALASWYFLGPCEAPKKPLEQPTYCTEQIVPYLDGFIEKYDTQKNTQCFSGSNKAAFYRHVPFIKEATLEQKEDIREGLAGFGIRTSRFDSSKPTTLIYFRFKNDEHREFSGSLLYKLIRRPQGKFKANLYTGPHSSEVFIQIPYDKSKE